MKKITTILAVLFFGMFVAVGSAMAVPQLDFGVISPTSGSISYGGNDKPLIGTNISVKEVVGLDTLLNDGTVLNLENASLNFTTGESTDDWVWGGGDNSSITITGDIPALDLYEVELLSGSFGFAKVFYLGNTFHISGASFSDTKHPELLDYYGLPAYLSDGTTPYPYSGNFNISFNAASTGEGSSFTSTSVLSGNIVNTPVPEPATMLFLGTSLLGLLVVSRRKMFKK